MKLGLILTCLLGGSAAFAADASVKITSFVMAGTDSPVAELCGKVSGGTPGATVVRVLVDPRGKPGVYNALVDMDGNFCTTVFTYTREATASIANGASVSGAPTAATVGVR